MIRLGQRLEYSLWYNAAKCLDGISEFGDQCVEPMINQCASYGFKCGEPTFSVLKPGDPRVPEVPFWLRMESGALPRLLVAEATVEVLPSSERAGGLVYDLDRKDLERLRAITRRVHKKYYPHSPVFTDEECDTMINSMGEEVVLDTLRQFKNSEI